MSSYLLFAVAAAIATAQEAQPGHGVNFYSLEKEAALGAALAADERRTTTPLDIPAVTGYLAALSARLTARLPGNQIALTFAVVTDKSGGPTYEPSVFPGGYVFIPSDLFLAAETESEFASMLAHSISHVAARHGTRMATRVEIATLASVPVVHVGGWDQANLLPRQFAQLHRVYELEADRLAVGMVAGAGLDPTALSRYIQRVQEPGPQREERLANLKSAAAEENPNEPNSADQFRAIREEVRRATEAPVRLRPSLNRPKN